MIDKEALRAQFERCSNWLDAALATHHGAYRLTDVWEQIESGRSLLWPLPNAVVVTTIKHYPTGLREMWGWLTGGELAEIQAFEPILRQAAKDMGCKAIILSGRRGWSRALRGYQEGGVLLRKEI